MPYPIKDKHYITQYYGLTLFAQSAEGKKCYKNFPGGIHPGIDIGTGGINSSVYSTCDGYVIRASMDGGWGNHVEIEGKDGWRRQYAHLSYMDVVKGQTIEKGLKIGKVGTTGNSTGIHLHYGHRRPKLPWGWDYRNPADEIDVLEEVPIPKSTRLIKAYMQPEIYVWNGTHIFHIPDEQTLAFLFPVEIVHEVSYDVLSKLPKGASLPSLKV
jgi:murein DD-endopeptidase MepM/ murein hydrolase activator NlpD